MHHPSATIISRSRLEFLFDGVFAIAMTLLVLELHVPELVDRHSVAELGNALREHAGGFASYLFAFVILGAFWFRHNHQYHHFRIITRPMLLLHFIQLAMAAFVPFCAALFGRYPFNPMAGLVYTSCISVYAWAAFATWVAAERGGALEEGLTDEKLRKSRKWQLRACLPVTALFGFYLWMVVSGAR